VEGELKENDKPPISDQCLGWPVQALFWLEWATTCTEPFCDRDRRMSLEEDKKKDDTDRKDPRSD
jgi:hypothetical protein